PPRTGAERGVDKGGRPTPPPKDMLRRSRRKCAYWSPSMRKFSARLWGKVGKRRCTPTPLSRGVHLARGLSVTFPGCKHWVSGRFASCFCLHQPSCRCVTSDSCAACLPQSDAGAPRCHTP